MPLVMMDFAIIVVVVLLWFLFASKFKAVGNFFLRLVKPFKEVDEDEKDQEDQKETGKTSE